MSGEKNKAEAQRWLDTARYDLESAELLAKNGRYAHACFLSQQSAEKALKALYFFRDRDGWGHSLLLLIEGVKDFDRAVYDRIEKLKTDALVLDKFYIPTRYPNGLPEITPETAYTEKEALEGIRIAKEFYFFIKGLFD